MSYEIEYSKHAFKSKNKYGDDAFFCYVMVCSNNVDPRTPRPMFFANGQTWNIIQQACRFGADCESGGYKPKNRWVSPESYIKNWRGVLKEAMSLEFLTNGRFVEMTIAVKKEVFQATMSAEAPKDKKYSFERLQKTLTDPRVKSEDRRWFDENLVQLSIHIKTYADVELYQELFYDMKELNLLYFTDLRGV